MPSCKLAMEQSGSLLIHGPTYQGIYSFTGCHLFQCLRIPFKEELEPWMAMEHTAGKVKSMVLPQKPEIGVHKTRIAFNLIRIPHIGRQFLNLVQQTLEIPSDTPSRKNDPATDESFKQASSG